jgi:DNA-binding LytR/AlgR family response regulator
MKSEEEYYGTIKETLDSVDETFFVRIHQSYIVNFSHIKKIKGDTVLMDNGHFLKISGTYSESFKKKYKDYIMYRMG